jgi:biopolymer transport protein ExbD
MARKRRRNSWEVGELNLTAMIDVAFQLLSFFVITAHPVDVFTKLSIIRPAPDQSASKESAVKMLTLVVMPRDFTLNDKHVDFQELNELMTKFAKWDKDQTVMIQCVNASPHKQLIRVLDLCSKLGLTNLSVVSSGGA